MEYLGYTPETRQVIVRLDERNFEALRCLAAKLQGGVKEVGAKIDYTNLWNFLRAALEGKEEAK